MCFGLSSGAPRVTLCGSAVGGTGGKGALLHQNSHLYRAYNHQRRKCPQHQSKDPRWIR